MERVYFTERNGRRILVQDLTDSKSVEESIATFDRTEALIRQEPPQSVRLLTNVTNAHYTTEAVDRLKRFSRDVTPWIHVSATVGISGIKRIIVQSLNRLTGRQIKICDTADQALDWLARQE